MKLIILLSLFNIIFSIPYDLLNRRYMNFNWLEFSTTTSTVLDSYSPWTTVRTSSVIPNTGTVVAFLSLPDLSNAVLGPPFSNNLRILPPIVPKMNGLPIRNDDGTFTFQFKLVHPNDSYCSKTWATPIPKRSRLVTTTWLVAVEGVYSILTNYTDESFNTNFVIGSGDITRASAAPVVTNSNGNAIQFIYPKGCNPSSPNDICTVNANAGSIQQLQTSVNTVDNGLPLFLSVRAWQVRLRQSWFVLAPHDSYDPNYFVIKTPEKLGYLIFPTGQTLVCIEGFAFETKTFVNVTSFAIPFQYANVYNNPPGIFGMLGSVYSIVDSTTLQSLVTTNSGAQFITKEDQCTTEQTTHTTPEIVHVLIVGRTNADPWLQCYASLKSAQTVTPTSQPTAYPTLEPSADPTIQPTNYPTKVPTNSPTSFPSNKPTNSPTSFPTNKPTDSPTISPSNKPTFAPTNHPTNRPTTETCIIIHIDQ